MAIGGTAIGDYSVSIGGWSYGYGSVALSSGTTEGIGSTAMSGGSADGYTSTAMSFGYSGGESSVAMSYGNSYGDYSTSFSYSTAEGSFSVAGGAGVVAQADSSAAFGTYNDPGAVYGVPGDGTTDGRETLFSIGNGVDEVRSNAITTQRSGTTTLKNKYWSPSAPIAVPSSLEGAEGNALIVEGHARLKGKVTIDEPQGDISMGIYQ